MKTLAILTAFSAYAYAHNPQVLSTSQSRRLHQTRSICSRDVHCILAHEATEGPYYIPDPLLRTNITEDRDGIPFKLNISVTDVTQCAPARGVHVDIWHADAHGVYSGWAGGEAISPRSDLNGIVARDALTSAFMGGPPPFSHGPQDSSRFLRGVAVTDDSGNAIFDTIMPGWYDGRTTHIHIRIHTGSVEVADGMLVGAGNVAHTGQLFFADSLVKDLAATTEPYKSLAKKLSPMLNGDDGIFLHSEGEEQVIRIESEGGSMKGFVGVGIDPEADHQEDAGFGGGRPGWESALAFLALVFIAIVAVLAYRRYKKSRAAAQYVALPLEEEESRQEEGQVVVSNEPNVYRDEE